MQEEFGSEQTDSLPSSARVPFFLRATTATVVFFGVLATVFDVAAFFALSTEGTDVTNKKEARASKLSLARVVNTSRTPTSFDRISLPGAFTYVCRRLPDEYSKWGETMGVTHTLNIPLRVDYMLDEKWLVNDPLLGTYATLTYFDYQRNVTTRYSKDWNVVFSKDEMGLSLSPQGTDFAFRQRKACSDTVGGARLIDRSSNRYEVCYSDEPRMSNCSNTADGANRTFLFRCSDITVSNYGRKINGSALDHYAGIIKMEKAPDLLHLNAARANSPNRDVSPAVMVTARIFAEFVTLYRFEERPFYKDATIVIVPLFVVIVIATAGSLGFVLTMVHRCLVFRAGLVVTSSWPMDLVLSLTSKHDSLNRRNRQFVWVGVVKTEEDGCKLCVGDVPPSEEEIHPGASAMDIV